MKSAFAKGSKTDQDEDQPTGAFQPVAMRDTQGTKSSANVEARLRRSTRANRNRMGKEHSESYEDNSHMSSNAEIEGDAADKQPKSKKLVFLSCRVYEKAKEHRVTNGTQIAKEILDESRKLKMNFDFKNVQRRVYDALNVLTALDMIKKDRNKIEFVRDINEVFGESHKLGPSSPEMNREDREAETHQKIQMLKNRKAKMLESIKQKRQYFDEITVQVALLKKLVRRNLKNEDQETTHATPDKADNNDASLDKFQNTKKIHLPMLVLEFKKGADICVMSEDHKKVVILSDSH